MLTPRASKGSIQCYNCLKILGVKRVDKEHTLKLLPNRRFDFKFIYNNRKYLLEYDGEQHFHRVPKFHKTIEDFHEGQRRDIIKTLAAINSKFVLIRISYSEVHNVRRILETQVFNNDNIRYYFSNLDKYAYIIRHLK